MLKKLFIVLGPGVIERIENGQMMMFIAKGTAYYCIL